MSEAKPQEMAPFALRAIYLRNSRIRMVEDLDPLLPGQEMHAQFRTEKTFRVLARETKAPGQKTLESLIFILGFAFRYSKPMQAAIQSEQSGVDEVVADDPNLLAEISAEIAIDYQIINGTASNLDPALVQNWGQGSAMVHAWPYWREYCHSAMIRMNLPLSLMPMIDIRSMQPMPSPPPLPNTSASPKKKPRA